LNLIREKTGKNRFFITKNALFNPETFISKLIKDELSHGLLTDSQNPNLET
jgi:ATP-dependent Clp protease ATP-binding subunit ClpX